MNTCCNCCEEKQVLINLPMYGFLCGFCYQEIIRDYLR